MSALKSLIVFSLVLLITPLFLRDPYVIHILTMSCIYAVLVSSWDVLAGYGGMFSFGHPVFFGLGGYVSALMAMRLGVSPWLGLVLGGGVASVIGLFIGLPVLRLRGPYLAIVTLSFMIIFHQICKMWTSLTMGPTGLYGIPPLSNLGKLVAFDGVNRMPYYFVAALLLIASTYVKQKFASSSIGIHLVALREDDQAAAAVGVNATRCKLSAFVLTSFFAGLAGGLYAHYIHLLTPGIFGFHLMVTIMTMNLLGGAGTVFGPVGGAFLLTFLSEYLREFGDFRLLLYGLFIVLAISFMPQGILKDLWVRFKRRRLLARANVPSK